ncbi:MAG: tail tape measure protein, partial [Rhodobacterales bacterium]|nr:tail tape measure protein [Rhodobacterales bacterium]MDX5499990.1 tail tape measure protein [Rhodobacterales bacterium]
MADVLGYGADTFAAFAHSLEVSTMGMTDEEAAAAVQEALADMSDGFADMIDGLDGLKLEGEGATDALTRLSAALSAVNPVMDTLGHSFRAAGLLGAGLASDLVMAFGGLDAFGQATARYYEVFYGEAERMGITTRQATEALADLGGIMPHTRDEYRAIIEGLDVTTEAGRDLYAAMVSMSDVFDFILPKVGALSAELEAMVTGISTGVDAMIAEATAAARANEQAAATWYNAASSIHDYIDRLRGTAGALISARDARAYNEARYQTLLAAAMGGDIGATQGLTGAAQALLDSTKATARTRVDLARAEARVLADLGLVQGVADIEGARHDVIAGLLGEQVALLEEVKEYLAGGGALDPAQIEALSGQLGALGEAIKAAEMINYAFLKERLEVSVDVLADADVPPYLRKLIKDAQTGISTNIDFITRSDLPADMKWLALTGESELLKTVDFAIGTTLPENLRWLAVQTAITMNKTINMLAGSKLDTETL